METISQILTKNLNITEINYDFNLYKKNYHTYFQNKEQELNVRYNNLHDIINILNKYNIKHWLQGKTLLGISIYGKLLINDSDEDIGLDYTNIKNVCNFVVPELEKIGFKVIRATQNNSMLSVMRNNRYLDFCFFRTQNDTYYYEKKIFPKSFYGNIINFKANEFTYSIPQMYKEICKFSYNV